MTLPKDPVKAEAYKEKIRKTRTGTKASDATKQKMGVSRSGEKNHNYGGNPELTARCQKMSVDRIGTTQTEETKQLRSEALKKYYEEHPEAKEQKKIQLEPYNVDRVYDDDYREKLSLAKQGDKHPNFGKHLPESTIEKIRVANSGPNCYHYGQSPSLETRIKMSESQKGEKCYNWKGGITKFNHSIRNCLQNREWIFAVFKRDDFTCQKCKTKGVYLHAHHIKPFAEILKEHGITTLEEAIACAELWDISNGISYCEECHKVEHFGESTED